MLHGFFLHYSIITYYDLTCPHGIWRGHVDLQTCALTVLACAYATPPYARQARQRDREPGPSAHISTDGQSGPSLER